MRIGHHGNRDTQSIQMALAGYLTGNDGLHHGNRDTGIPTGSIPDDLMSNSAMLTAAELPFK